MAKKISNILAEVAAEMDEKIDRGKVADYIPELDQQGNSLLGTVALEKLAPPCLGRSSMVESTVFRTMEGIFLFRLVDAPQSLKQPDDRKGQYEAAI